MRILILCMCCIALTGCSLLQNIDTAEYHILIKSAARTGTYFGLVNAIENTEERQEIATTIKSTINDNVLPFLEGDGVVLTESNVSLLLAKIPVNLRAYLRDAIDILNSYMKKNNTYDLLDVHAIALLKTLFLGVIEGCDMVLLEEVLNDGMGNNSNARFEQCPEGGAYPFARRPENFSLY